MAPLHPWVTWAEIGVDLSGPRAVNCPAASAGSNLSGGKIAPEPDELIAGAFQPLARRKCVCHRLRGDQTPSTSAWQIKNAFSSPASQGSSSAWSPEAAAEPPSLPFFLPSPSHAGILRSFISAAAPGSRPDNTLR